MSLEFIKVFLISSPSYFKHKAFRSLVALLSLWAVDLVLIQGVFLVRIITKNFLKHLGFPSRCLPQSWPDLALFHL